MKSTRSVFERIQAAELMARRANEQAGRAHTENARLRSLLIQARKVIAGDAHYRLTYRGLIANIDDALRDEATGG